MSTVLPFRHKDEKTFLSRVHPVIRLVLPFILVVPFLVKDDLYLIFTNIILTVMFGFVARVKFSRILSRVLKIIPFVILITFIIPFYIGEIILYQFYFFIEITIYQEGLARAILLFMRIIGSIFIFMSFFSTLTYSEFIEALTTLRLPSFFVGSLVIMLHYIPIIASSNRTILEAQELRGKKITTYWQKVKTHAFIMGKSLVTNMERSEKLYDSLKMRGFTGKLTFISRKLKLIDLLITTLFLFTIIFLVFFVDLRAI